MQTWLTGIAAVLGMLAAASWYVSTLTISREQELERRCRIAARRGEPPNLGGVNIGDERGNYDLIATLYHQGRWNRIGAALTALSVCAQALAPLVAKP